jgi:hypothetical protein
MSKELKPGIMCFIVNCREGSFGFPFMGRVVSLVEKSQAAPKCWVTNPSYQTPVGRLVVDPVNLMSIDGGELGEDLFTSQPLSVDKPQLETTAV